MANKILAFEKAIEITKIAAANLDTLTNQTGSYLGDFLDEVYEAICKVHDKATNS